MFIITYPSVSFSETWTCSYLFKGKQKIFVRERYKGGFIDPTYKPSSVDLIIRENSEFIHLYLPQKHFKKYFATILHKEKKQFLMVALNPFEKNIIIQGDCEIY